MKTEQAAERIRLHRQRPDPGETEWNCVHIFKSNFSFSFFWLMKIVKFTLETLINPATYTFLIKIFEMLISEKKSGADLSVSVV